MWNPNMGLAAIFGIYLALSCPGLGSFVQPRGLNLLGLPAWQAQQQAPASPAPAAPTAEPAASSPSSSSRPTPNSASPAKVAPKQRHKKTVPANCSDAPSALSPTVGKTSDSNKTASSASTDTSSGSKGSAAAGSADANHAPGEPCPPPRKVVRNGGSQEPTIQLVGGATPERTLQDSIEQLTVAIDANLKKVEGRELSSNQQEMVSQIKQFMEESKKAASAGDLQRGHNLAMKAHLLSNELVKP